MSQKLTQEDLQETHVQVFRTEATFHPQGCCTGRTWYLEVENGSVYLVTPMDVRESVESSEWKPVIARTVVAK